MSAGSLQPLATRLHPVFPLLFGEHLLEASCRQLVEHMLQLCFAEAEVLTEVCHPAKEELVCHETVWQDLVCRLLLVQEPARRHYKG